MTATYRLKQGIRALFAFAQPVDMPLAAQYLSAAQLALFQKMTRSEQLHSLNVLRTVLEQAADTPHDLAVVALLHDCGKSRYALNVAQRTLSVLTEKLLPALFQRLTRDDTLARWRAAFVVRRHHPAWSARLLAEAGSSENVVWLAAHHADSLNVHVHHPLYTLLARLKAADDAN
jgi:hypothetical protein